MMARLNEHLCANIPSNRLITLFYAEIDGRSGEMSYVNAGHNPPFVLRGGGIQERLGATSVALGILPGEAYPVSSLLLGSLDRLLLYTDGITEAFNTADEEYGEERLAAYLDVRRHATHKELVAGLIESVLLFCGSERPRDDMTLMVVGRVPV